MNDRTIDTSAARAGTGGGQPPSPPALRRVVASTPGPEELRPEQHRRRSRRIDLALGLGVPLCLLAWWQVGADQGWVDRQFFPAPTDIWSAGIDLARDGTLWSDLVVTMRRVVLGFALGSGAGVAVGVVLGTVPRIRAALEPLLYALWTVPKLALLPLFLLIFGLGERSIVALISVTCFFVVAIAATHAITAVPAGYREAAVSFRANRLDMLRHVLFPCALPQIVVSLRLNAGISILTAVAAEFVQGDDGIGYVIWHSWTLFLPSRMYVGIVVVALAGVAFTGLIGLLERILTPWVRSR